MQFKASHRYARMGARKARLVVDLIRGRTANQALDTLANDNHRASFYVRKVLASAVANALQNPDVRASRLVVSRAYVNEGPLLQGRMRWRPGPMGRAMPFRRRTCHIHVEVQDPNLSELVTDVVPEPTTASSRKEADTTAGKAPAEGEPGGTEKPAKKASAKKGSAGSSAKKPVAKKAATKKAAPRKPAKKKSDQAEDKD